MSHLFLYTQYLNAFCVAVIATDILSHYFPIFPIYEPKNQNSQKEKVMFETYDETIESEKNKLKHVQRNLDLTSRYFHFLVMEHLKVNNLIRATKLAEREPKLDLFAQIELYNNKDVIDKKLKYLNKLNKEIHQFVIREYRSVKNDICVNIEELEYNKKMFLEFF